MWTIIAVCFLLLGLGFLIGCYVGYHIGVADGRKYQRKRMQEQQDRSGKNRQNKVENRRPVQPGPMAADSPEKYTAPEEPEAWLTGTPEVGIRVPYSRETPPEEAYSPSGTGNQREEKPAERPEEKPALPTGSYGRRQLAVTPSAIETLYSSFAAENTLKLEFDYSFPDNIILKEGSGYIVNSRGELLPDKAVFTGANPVTAYAMNGLLRIFDASCDGRKYDFDRIMDGALGKNYVRISGVENLAVVEMQRGYGFYTLVSRGCLRIDFI